MEMELTASVVFSSMAVFSLLRDRLNTILFLLNTLVTGKVSLDRVNDFLNNVSFLQKCVTAFKSLPRQNFSTPSQRRPRVKLPSFQLMLPQT